MLQNNSIHSILNLAVLRTENREEKDIYTCCQQCGYKLERPHALACTRCGSPIPGAQGCKGCGRCRKR